jgi:uncharacterized protein
MEKKDLLKTIITDNQTRSLPEIWKRTLELPQDTNKIITLVGVRRSGKTYHLFNQIKKLLQQGIPPESILYFNFEDERIDATTDILDLILQCFQELNPNTDLPRCYFFFDEIQTIPNWEKFITRTYETITKKIYITGSNATLLSQEIASALRGRTISYEVFPFSFRELVWHTYPSINPKSSFGKAKLVTLFQQFLHQGGFPELLGLDDAIRIKVLQEYFNVMVLRDLIERYSISQTTILKYFCKRIVSNSANEFSVNKIFNELKSQGYKIGKNVLYDYQSFAEAIYLNRLVPKFDESIIKSELSRKKTYVIDQGLGSALDFKLSQDLGRLLETTVGLELIKQGKDISYSHNGTECDFIIKNNKQVIGAIQVALHLEDETTKNREIRGLVNACKRHHLKKGTIICLEHTEEFVADGILIQVHPAWSYFL